MAATSSLRSSFLSKLRTSCKNHYRPFSAKPTASSSSTDKSYFEEEEVPTSGISRPLSEILKELNKKVPDSLIRARNEPDGFSIKYIPWFVLSPSLCIYTQTARDIVYV